MSVVLSDLPVAPSADNSDVTLLRKGLTDYQCAVNLIRNINVAGLSALPGGTAQATDLFLISRTITGTPTNFQFPFSKVSFLKGTRIWFYQAAAPVGWTIVSGAGDRLLACAGSTSPYAGKQAGTQGGDWQQQDVSGIAGTGLSILQIPNHNHYAAFGENQSNADAQYIHGAKNPNSGGDPLFGKKPKVNPVRGIVGGKGDNATHDNYGQCDPHNHGSAWRPKANIGIICNKTN